MIVDCHSHIWLSSENLGDASTFSCLSDGHIDEATAQQHREACIEAEVTFVLGFVSRLLNAQIPNDLIQTYVKENPGRVIGFAGIDPTDRNCPQQVRDIQEAKVFSGLTLSPACQGFHPCDSRAMAIYELAQNFSLPIYFLQGELLPAQADLSFAHPSALDEVARTFPNLKIVVSHLGYPWIDQMISLLGKHPNVFSDVAGITNKPWQAYRTLSLAYEHKVIDKLLFASDFPSQTVKAAVETLYNLNKLTIDSVLPAIPREQLRGIVERDSLSLLGLSA